MEVAANDTEGVKSAVVNFMMLKMNVEFEDGVQPKEVMARVLENCKKVEDDCEIFFLMKSKMRKHLYFSVIIVE